MIVREVYGSAKLIESGIRPKRLARPVGIMKYGKSERERSTLRKPEPICRMIVNMYESVLYRSSRITPRMPYTTSQVMRLTGRRRWRSASTTTAPTVARTVKAVTSG
jgi:hypothetical protein